MRERFVATFAIIAAIIVGFAEIGPGQEPKKTAKPPKKIFVELYTSQGCDSCPPASQLLGKLAAMGYGPDKIVTVGFHVDYFNDPWPDPYSDQAFSRRQMEYNQALGRDDLYMTPLLMVNGTAAMLGSDRSKVLASLEKALKEPPGVAIDLDLNGSDKSRTLTVSLKAPSRAVAARDLVVGVAVTENPISTRVRSGENGGKTLVEHYVVRDFTIKPAKIESGETASLIFPLDLRPKQSPEKTSIAVFVQDRQSGAVYQSESIRWTGAESR